MGLTSMAFAAAALLLALGLPVCAVFAWNRVAGPRPWRLTQRLGLVLLAQASAVLLAMVSVNDQYLFYTSWQDLLGSSPAAGEVTALGRPLFPGVVGTGRIIQATSQRESDGGRLITEYVRGASSQLAGRVLIHLPTGFSPSRSYPVVELLQGWHAPPDSWIKNLDVVDALDRATRRGSLSSVIAVMPDINIAAPRDAECTDVPHGPQAEAWLTTDIHSLVQTQFPAESPTRRWGLMGFSTGGYCAAKLLLHRPDWYGSAVVMSGYFEAIKDRTTGDLWGGSRSLRDWNSPLWLAAHHSSASVDLLAFASRYDTESYASTARFLKTSKASLRLSSLIAPHGGHNFKALRAALPAMLGWLGEQLAKPDLSAPLLAPPSAQPTSPAGRSSVRTAPHPSASARPQPRQAPMQPTPGAHRARRPTAHPAPVPGPRSTPAATATPRATATPAITPRPGRPSRTSSSVA